LKAGTNTIYIHAPGAPTLDAADIDALDVQASGHGIAAPPAWPKLVTPVVAGNRARGPHKSAANVPIWRALSLYGI
jgi:hypothetical protein